MGIKDAIRNGMDQRAQASQVQAAHAQAAYEQRQAIREGNYRVIAAEVPLALIPDDVALPGKVQLFADEFVVSSSDSWGGMSTRQLVLTTQRLIYARGYLSQQQEIVYLTDIRDVAYSKPLLGPGTIAVDTSSGRLEGMPQIRNGQQFRDTLLAIVQYAKQRQLRGSVPAPAPVYSAAPAPGGDSIPEKIAQLAQLRDSGAISLSDFDTKKAELLSRM